MHICTYVPSLVCCHILVILSFLFFFMCFCVYVCIYFHSLSQWQLNVSVNQMLDAVNSISRNVSLSNSSPISSVASMMVCLYCSSLLFLLCCVVLYFCTVL